MTLGGFETDKALIYIGFWIFSETLKFLKPWFPVVVTGVLFFLVWRVLKTGDWLHTIGGYLFYVILLIVLLSHTTTITWSNLRSRASDTGQKSANELAIQDVASKAQRIEIPTIFLATIRAIDAFTNGLANKISAGKYFKRSFIYIHSQSALANSRMDKENRRDYISFCEQCYGQALLDVENGKLKTPPPPQAYDWFIGCKAYRESYKMPNHKITWFLYSKEEAAKKGKLGIEVNCDEAYVELRDKLTNDVKDKFVDIRGLPKVFIDSLMNVANTVKGLTGQTVAPDDALCYAVLFREERLHMATQKVQGQLVRNVLPNTPNLIQQIAKGRLGTWAAGITAPFFLAWVSLVIKLLPLAQGFCLCFCIGAFPIIILLSLFPGHISILKTAILTILQIGMWSVCWSIISLISSMLPRLLPHGSSDLLLRLDIPAFCLLGVIAAPIISGVFITRIVRGLESPNIPVANPTGAISKAIK